MGNFIIPEEAANAMRAGIGQFKPVVGIRLSDMCRDTVAKARMCGVEPGKMLVSFGLVRDIEIKLIEEYISNMFNMFNKVMKKLTKDNIEIKWSKVLYGIGALNYNEESRTTLERIVSTGKGREINQNEAFYVDLHVTIDGKSLTKINNSKLVFCIRVTDNGDKIQIVASELVGALLGTAMMSYIQACNLQYNKENGGRYPTGTIVSRVKQVVQYASRFENSDDMQWSNEFYAGIASICTSLLDGDDYSEMFLADVLREYVGKHLAHDVS